MFGSVRAVSLTQVVHPSILSNSVADGGSAAASNNCLQSNDWVCWEYVRTRSDLLVEAGREHIYITLVSLAVGFVLAFGLALVVRRWRRLSAFVLGTSTVLYTVPSLAMFALLIPVMQAVGVRVLSTTTVVVGLTMYTLIILIRGVVTGLDGVSSDVREAAVGMGYGPGRLLRMVELPLALPAIFGALRVAMVSTVALTTVGLILNHGGFGNLISSGLDNNFKSEVLTASVLTVLLAIAGDLLLRVLERLTTPWKRGLA